jgi:hypothetical protein
LYTPAAFAFAVALKLTFTMQVRFELCEDAKNVEEAFGRRRARPIGLFRHLERCTARRATPQTLQRGPGARAGVSRASVTN